MTETSDWAKTLISLPFIRTIFYLNWFTENITYIITPLNIHTHIAEGINIAQWRTKIKHAYWFQDCIWHKKIVVSHINIHTCMYACMCDCEDWMQETEDHGKGLLGTRDFQLSHKKNPCHRSLMKIHQHGAEIFNEMCSFEVSIGLLPHILIVSSKESLL